MAGPRESTFAERSGAGAAPPARRRIAILGGGPAALATAYHLTTTEPGRYEITIYEMSWRLGGKTASGRDAQGRIEEHGLHVLFGGYHNTFDMMLGCYRAVRAECGAGTLPFDDFLDAVVPSSYGVIGDDRLSPWRRWDLQFPINGGLPGDPPLPRTVDVFSALAQLAVHVVLGAGTLRWLQRWLFRGAWRGERWVRRPTPATANAPGGDWFLHRIVLPFCRLLLDSQRIGGRVVQSLGRLGQRLLHATEPLARRLGEGGLPPRLWTAVDLVLATCRGLCRDRVLFRSDGYSRLDRVELRAWLRHHGARRQTLASPFARVIYEATFQGFFTERIAAGAALRILLWMTFTYKGTMYYKLRGGTGDVVNLPLYLLLRQRGVKFAFFHRVQRVRPGAGPQGEPVIAEIDVQRLARPLPGADYDPLVRVGGHLSWPSLPVTERLHPEDRAQAAEAESFFQQFPAAEGISLRHGVDFDEVVFAIPVACIPFVCPDLTADQQGLWHRQQKIEATATVALQLWTERSLRELGWRRPPPLLSLFWDPLNTWCDMGQVLPFEPWTDEDRPRMVAYFCGPFVADWSGPEAARLDPAVDRAFRARIAAQAREAQARLFQHLGELWPAVRADQGGLAALGRRTQYLRVNQDPHARCTLALPRQTANRIAADRTGYTNLTVAGDWTANRILVACLEGTVQSGIRAARALSTQPALYRIVGEALLDPDGPAPRPVDEERPPPRAPRPPGAARRILGRFAPGRTLQVDRPLRPERPPEQDHDYPPAP